MKKIYIIMYTRHATWIAPGIASKPVGGMVRYEFGEFAKKIVWVEEWKYVNRLPVRSDIIWSAIRIPL